MREDLDLLQVRGALQHEQQVGVTHALQEHLLGRLRRDAPEGAARLLHVEHGAELFVLLTRALGIRVETTGDTSNVGVNYRKSWD